MLSDSTTRKPYVAHTDGGSRGNPGPAASAFVLVSPQGYTMRMKQFHECLTNNEAEYSAMNALLEHLVHLEPQAPVEIFTDSTLIVGQVAGTWKINQETLRPYVEKARALYDVLCSMTPTTMQHIRREFNKEADALCNEAMDAFGATYKRMVKK